MIINKNQKLKPNKRDKIINTIIIVNLIAIIIVSVIAYVVY